MSTAALPFQPFNQPAPKLGNQYQQDRVLQQLLKRVLPATVLSAIEADLHSMGELTAGELLQLQQADRLLEPELTHFDAWGNRIDQVEVTPLWKRAETVAATHGLIANAYDDRFGRYNRLHQFALVYLFGPSTDVYNCPLAMTDGAANCLLQSGNQALLERAFAHLTSRDPEQFWTSGQWMTESTGGSDVGRSETRAEQGPDGQWRLYGRKWFTSAVTADMTLTLARPAGNGKGGSGLAMFYLETRQADGSLNNIEVLRLKDKLGTRKVPTAELVLNGAIATPVGELRNGTRAISPMLNVTRTWNAVSALGGMRRGIALARDYAGKREAFGAKLADKPLHQQTLADLQAEFEAAMVLVFRSIELLGLDQAGEANQSQQRLLRMLTPLIKLMTGKQGVAIASEVLECFGGAGYVEDTGLPLLLRDAQVLPIWEGTTNVLSLDTLRALAAGPEPLIRELAECSAAVNDARIRGALQVAQQGFDAALQWLQAALADGGEVEAGARRFALTVARSLALAELCRHAQWCLDEQGDRRPQIAASRFARSAINLIQSPSELDEAAALANDLPL